MKVMNENLRNILNLIDDKHAKDIEIYEVGSQHPMFDTVIVASVDVVRNMDAILGEIKKQEKEGLIEVKSVESNNKEWVVVDFYDTLLHVFVKETRQFYDLDTLLAKYQEKNENVL